MTVRTVPSFKVNVNGVDVDIHPVDLKYIAECMIVSPEFLVGLSKCDKPLIRNTAAGHVCTPLETLTSLLYDESPLVYFAALENPQTPFEAVLYRWNKLMPQGTVWDSPAIVGRHEDLKQLLKKYNITEKESRSMPATWIAGIIEDV